MRTKIISLNMFLSQWFVGIKYHNVVGLVNIRYATVYFTHQIITSPSIGAETLLFVLLF